MGKFRVLTATVLGLSSAGAGAQAAIPWDLSTPKVKGDAAKHCSALVPDSLSLQVVCRRHAIDGATKFVEVAARHVRDKAMMRALDHCHSLMTEGGVTNWSLAGTCAEREERALAQLAD